MPDEDESPHGDHVWRCVADEKKAWHVRKQVKFPIDNKRDINSRSVGIEIVNAQIGEGDPFSQWQVAVTAQTVNYYRSKHPDRRFYLATHSFLDPERRNDPGNIFDWQRFMSLLETGEPELVDVDDYAADAVSWVKEQGLMTGVSEQLFGGRDPVKRQDLAIILKRLHDGLKPADEG
jgi:N-acetyl-anhydromuramyl-L-alanine amidase AmpD